MSSSEQIKRLADAYRVDPIAGLKPIIGRVVAIINEDVILGDVDDLNNRIWQAPVTSYLSGRDEVARYSPMTLDQAMTRSYTARQSLVEKICRELYTPGD